MKQYREVKRQLLKNKKVREEYDLLEPEFMIKQKMIELRLKKKITQLELAKKVGTKQSSISRFENELANPTLSFLSRLSSALGKRLVVDFK